MSFRSSYGSIFFLVCLAGCGLNPQPDGPRRLALLPFENLSSDSSLAWVSRAVPGIAAYQLATFVKAMETPDVRAASAFSPTEEISGYFERTAGKLRINAVVRDPKTQKTLRSFVIEEIEPLRAADSLARQLANRVRPFPTQKAAAVESYFRASVAQDQAEALALLAKSTEEDSGFTLAHLLLIRAALARKDTGAAKSLLEEARRNSTSFTVEDRAKLDLMESELTGNVGMRIAALGKLTDSDADNVEYWRAYGQSAVQLHDYPKAIRAFEALTRIDPLSFADWNSLGYARVYAGDLGGSVKALEEYRRLAPADANAIDSLGEVHFYSRKFPEAARYFLEAHQKQPQLLQGGHLFRAAFSLHAGGDTAGADKLFRQYLDFRANAKDPAVGVREAAWLYMTGRRESAIAAGSASQKCLWHLDGGQFAEAKQEAVTLAGYQDLGSQLCLLLTQPVTGPDGWKSLIEKTVPAAQARAELTAVALSLNGYAEEAHAMWEQLAKERSPESASEARIMTAAMRPGGPALQVLPPRSPDPGFLSIAWSKFK